MSRYETFDRSRLEIKPLSERKHDLQLSNWLALDDPTPPFEHPDLGTVRQVASPLRLSGAERPPGRGPFRGEHIEQVLVELCGYEPERVRELAAAGVFG